MSLLQNLKYEEYEKALKFPYEMCSLLAKIAKIRADYREDPCPGVSLMRDLDRLDYSVARYHKLLDIYNSKVSTNTAAKPPRERGFLPSAKVAILVANEMYEMQGKLKTPVKDCREVGAVLRSLGYVVVLLKDVTAREIERFLQDLVDAVPYEAYFFLYVAGHGAEINNVRYLFGVDSFNEGLLMSQVISAHRLLRLVCERRPMQCVLLMDVCSNCLDSDKNPDVFRCGNTESYRTDGHVVIGYSSSADEAAYEEIELSCSSGEASSVLALDTARHAAADGTGSQYAAALARHLPRGGGVATVLDRVAATLLNAKKKQTPVKIEIGQRKLYLTDPVSGDQRAIYEDIKKSLSDKNAIKYALL